jgi:hypothetical protein
MSEPELNQTTAEVAEDEPDFAGEHDKPSWADEKSDNPALAADDDNDTPRGLAGAD